jgi:glycosyltransferase involved in cell wall biosynthesis
MTSVAKIDKPLVSIYIPTKNRPEMLERAINSVLAQTYPHIEIIVSDDGSTDHTPQFMNELITKHANIKYLRSENSQGACHARNQAILAANGEYVTGLDDDDRFTKDRVKEFVESYTDNVAFLCSLTFNFNGSKFIPSRYYQRTITLNDIFRRNCVGNQIFIKKSDLINNNLLFDENFPAWQDFDFFSNLILNLGSAKRIFSRSYIMHTDHEKERITNPKRISKGYHLYLKKYKSHMKKNQRASLAVNAYLLQGKKVPKQLTSICIKCMNFYDLFKIIKARK